MNGLNAAFERLRHVVPNLTAEQKLSKIETLRMAQAYINTLASLLQDDDMSEWVADHSDNSANSNASTMVDL